MMDDPWDEYWLEESETYDFESMPDNVIMGLGDGYDDGRIDSLIFAFLDLRSRRTVKTRK